MIGNEYARNSICVVEAMGEKGENDWQIVPGFAFNPNNSNPFAHIWVRKGDQHYDPTWSLRYYFKWDFKELLHYRLVQPLEAGPEESEKNIFQRITRWGDDTLREITDLAIKWKLEIGDYE